MQLLLQSKEMVLVVSLFTMFKGQGSQDPPLIGQYFSSDMIICVIDDPKLDVVLDSIASVACTGTKGDGKVFVTTS
jgi:Nitrogen regulatory protein P-II.